MEKSFIEYAFDLVSASKKPVPFKTIWEHVKKAAELSDELAAKKVGQFYTNMLLDGRFVNLGDNQWDLRERHTYDTVHIPMGDVYSDVESSDDDSEEEAEEKEYNEAFEEKEENRADETEPEESEETESDNSDKF